MTTLIRQRTAAPTRKVAWGGAAGGISTLIIIIAQALGINIPAEITAAIATLVTAGAAYCARERV